MSSWVSGDFLFPFSPSCFFFFFALAFLLLLLLFLVSCFAARDEGASVVLSTPLLSSSPSPHPPISLTQSLSAVVSACVCVRALLQTGKNDKGETALRRDTSNGKGSTERVIYFCFFSCFHCLVWSFVCLTVFRALLLFFFRNIDTHAHTCTHRRHAHHDEE